jgi:asparagine N-glycosylation enzyme membrane subunit Stt3
MSEKDKIKISDEDNVISVDRKDIEITKEEKITRIEGEKPPIEVVRENYQDEIKEGFGKIFNFLKTKKWQWIVVGILLLAIIIFGSWIRIQNLDLLKDSTTGESIPLALDPFYFLRVAETIVDNGGELPEADIMRVKSTPTGFTKEILPQVTVLMWKTANIFGDYSIQHIHNLYPVVFFILGLIIFFLLTWHLSNSKMTAFIGSFMLAVIPSYLYRTLAGFADHEAIGIFAFLLTLLAYSFSLNYLYKRKSEKSSIIKDYSGEILIGLLTAFTIISWGGIAKFVFMIIPFSFFIFWIFYTKENDKKELMKFTVFPILWIISTLIFSQLFGIGAVSVLNAFMLSSSGILTLFVTGFVLVDYILIKKKDLILKNAKYEKHRILLSIAITGIIWLVVLGIMKGNFSIFSEIIARFKDPFGTDRLGLTVAENKQPYLSEWMGQTGKWIFWLFIAGLCFVGLNLSKLIKKFSGKTIFFTGWIIFVFGAIFSRISAQSLLNGNNFLSNVIYFGSVVVFLAASLYIYYNDKIKTDSKLIIILSWTFFMLIAGRGAARLFFVLTPFMVFMAGYATMNFYYSARKSKDELWRIIMYALLILSIGAIIFSTPNFVKSSLTQAQYTGPSADVQWQKAMNWVRNNTTEDSIFAHWWDYGYWVEYLGERPVISDGGHFQGTFRDHLIGRYILTNPSPESAISFMKSNNVSYLLIDQTDIGKYPAYSSIGSNPEWDRMASITTMISDPAQIQETSTGETRFYSGTGGVGDDIIYNNNGSTIFLPGATFNKYGSPSYKSYIAGVILNVKSDGNSGGFSIEQPQGIFVYEGRQIRIPLRYVYYGSEKIDFLSGLETGIKIIPRAYSSGSSGGVQIDYLGAAMYFDSRTINSLVVQLFLLGDPDNRYPTIKLVHTEDHSVVSSLKAQGIDLDEFVIYQGIHGPIKIFEVEYSDDILINEEFTRYAGEWAEFDEVEVLG